MALPDTAEPYWTAQQAISAATVALAVRLWRNADTDPTKWATAVPTLVAAMNRAQRSAAKLAGTFVGDTAQELGIAVNPLATIDPTPLFGVTGAGLPYQDLYENLPEQFDLHATRLAERAGIDIAPQALRELPTRVLQEASRSTEMQLGASVQTALSDTGRAVESMEIAVRPGFGYVRMLNPPSCDRCVILAGKWFKWSDGFERHPRCDCRHVPAVESIASDLIVNPHNYFHSLSVEDQDKTFGSGSAQAIRDGADISQVVNAKLGQRVAQVYGRNLKITTQGTSKRGAGGRAIRARGKNPATTPRLMPSSIYQIADDRDDAIRLLRMNGYLK